MKFTMILMLITKDTLRDAGRREVAGLVSRWRLKAPKPAEGFARQSGFALEPESTTCIPLRQIQDQSSPAKAAREPAGRVAYIPDALLEEVDNEGPAAALRVLRAQRLHLRGGLARRSQKPSAPTEASGSILERRALSR